MAAEALVNQVYNASEGMGDISLMFPQLEKLVVEKGEQTTKESGESSQELPKKLNVKKVKPGLGDDDIRNVVQLGHKRGLATEEALEEKGYVREVDELLGIIS